MASHDVAPHESAFQPIFGLDTWSLIDGPCLGNHWNEESWKRATNWRYFTVNRRKPVRRRQFAGLIGAGNRMLNI